MCIAANGLFHLCADADAVLTFSFHHVHLAIPSAKRNTSLRWHTHTHTDTYILIHIHANATASLLPNKLTGNLLLLSLEHWLLFFTYTCVFHIRYIHRRRRHTYLHQAYKQKQTKKKLYTFAREKGRTYRRVEVSIGNHAPPGSNTYIFFFSSLSSETALIWEPYVNGTKRDWACEQH